MSSGGPGSGLFKSLDGGATWTELTHNPGMPGGLIGKIGVSVSPADDKRVYAIIENANGGVFVSDDAGATWRRTNDSRDLRQRAFCTRGSPPTRNSRTGSMRVTSSSSVPTTAARPPDQGQARMTTITTVDRRHDNQRMIEANDGSANTSINGGKELRVSLSDGADLPRHDQPP
jgi:photosystem II stability/assembly factor-like uncharacterized protein